VKYRISGESIVNAITRWSCGGGKAAGGAHGKNLAAGWLTISSASKCRA